MSRSHQQHEVRETSVISYSELVDLGEKQRRVYKVINDHATLGLFLTDREIARFLGYFDPNKVRPRRFELMKKGLIAEAGKKVCSVSRRVALTWKTVTDPVMKVEGNVAVQLRFLELPEWTKLSEIMLNYGFSYAGDMKWIKK